MRSISSNLRAEIEAGFVTYLALITLTDGTKYGYSDHDVLLTIDGQDYHPAPGLKVIRMTATSSAEVSTQELGSAWVDVPQEDLIAGKFDDAILETSWCSWRHPEYGRFIFYKGQLGLIEWTEEGYKAEISSSMKNLAKTLGTVYTANCRHQLYSTSTSVDKGDIGFCGVDPVLFSGAGSVTAVITPKWKFSVDGITQPDGYFTNGTITFTSGTSTGLTYNIKNHTGSTLLLALPTAFVIPVGTTFTLKAGCDKTTDMCKTKFNNMINFGGFPHIQTDVTYRS